MANNKHQKKHMRGSYCRVLALACTLAGLAGPLISRADIPVTGSGVGPLIFDTAPVLPDWSTVSLVSGGGTFLDVASLTTAIQMQTAPLAEAPPTDTTDATHGRAYWNSAAKHLFTHPTANGATLLAATFVNNAGSDITAMVVSYTLGEGTYTANGEGIILDGHIVYYSLTGLPNSWVQLPGAPTGPSAVRAGTPLTFAMDLSSTPWPSGTRLFMLWADDNGNGNTDAAYTIDDFTISGVVAGPMTPPVITVQPVGTTVDERQVVRLSVTATGSGLTYQWYREPSSPIAGATGPVYYATNRLSDSRYPWSTPADNGTYYVVITGTLPPAAVSTHVTVTVTPDTTAPTPLYAVCGATADEYRLTLSEPMNNAGLELTDQFLWDIREASDNSPLSMQTGLQMQGDSVYTDNGVNRVIVFTATGRDPTKSYKIVRLSGTIAVDTARTPNQLTPGLSAPLLCFTNEILSLGAVWKYNDTGEDLGPNWYTGPDSLFPSSGPGIFDAKRDNANPNALPYCRAAIPNGLPVGTCTQLSNTTTLVFITNHFFRTHFSFGGNPSQVILQMETYSDDGAEVYLNGSVLENLGMPAGPLSNVTLASRGHDPDREVFLYAQPALLHSGDNVIAAQAAQNSAGSSDITWGCRLSVLQSTPPITVSIVDNGNGTVNVSWTPAGGTLKSSTTINAPRASWSTVGTTSPQTVTKTGTQKFFDVSVP